MSTSRFPAPPEAQGSQLVVFRIACTLALLDSDYPLTPDQTAALTTCTQLDNAPVALMDVCWATILHWAAWTENGTVPLLEAQHQAWRTAVAQERDDGSPEAESL